MARIRSVRPEFANDENMLQLSDSCALFFILLKNHCDDEGKIKNEPAAIAKKVCRWHKGKVQLFINSLTTMGQLRINSTSTWLQVTDFSDQRPNKPILPKVKSTEIQWIATKCERSTTEPLRSHEPQGEERRGEEKERIVIEEAGAISKVLKEKKMWGEQVCMKHKISAAALVDWIEKFRTHIVTQEKVPKENDAAAHFDNWLRIKLSEKKMPANEKRPIPPSPTGKFGRL